MISVIPLLLALGTPAAAQEAREPLPFPGGEVEVPHRDLVLSVARLQVGASGLSWYGGPGFDLRASRHFSVGGGFVVQVGSLLALSAEGTGSWHARNFERGLVARLGLSASGVVSTGSWGQPGGAVGGRATVGWRWCLGPQDTERLAMTLDLDGGVRAEVGWGSSRSHDIAALGPLLSLSLGVAL